MEKSTTSIPTHRILTAGDVSIFFDPTLRDQVRSHRVELDRLMRGLLVKKTIFLTDETPIELLPLIEHFALAIHSAIRLGSFIEGPSGRSLAEFDGHESSPVFSRVVEVDYSAMQGVTTAPLVPARWKLDGGLEGSLVIVKSLPQDTRTAQELLVRVAADTSRILADSSTETIYSLWSITSGEWGALQAGLTAESKNELRTYRFEWPA